MHYRHELKEGALRIEMSPGDAPVIKLLLDTGVAHGDVSYDAVYKYDELLVICPTFADLDELRCTLEKTPDISIGGDLVAIHFMVPIKKKLYEVDFYLTRMTQPITMQLRIENAKLKQRIEILESDVATQKLQIANLIDRVNMLCDVSRDL